MLAFPGWNWPTCMHRGVYKSVLIPFSFIVLSGIPAHGQIVSYMDTSGKRVFINAEPVETRRRIDPSIRGIAASLGSSKLAATGGPHATMPGVLASPLTGPAERANRDKIEEMIREVSTRYSVDPALIRSVIQTESNWNSTAVSSKGALGLMQLIPGTAQQMGVANALDARQNIDGGVHYLHSLLERYNGDLDKSLAAYNAGPGAVDRAKGVPQYRETQAYVQKVTSSYFRSDSGRLSRPFNVPHRIYRATETDGRVVFTNE